MIKRFHFYYYICYIKYVHIIKIICQKLIYSLRLLDIKEYNKLFFDKGKFKKLKDKKQ
jgi:hypothetical protein